MFQGVRLPERVSVSHLSRPPAGLGTLRSAPSSSQPKPACMRRYQTLIPDYLPSRCLVHSIAPSCRPCPWQRVQHNRLPLHHRRDFIASLAVTSCTAAKHSSTLTSTLQRPRCCQTQGRGATLTVSPSPRLISTCTQASACPPWLPLPLPPATTSIPTAPSTPPRLPLPLLPPMQGPASHPSPPQRAALNLARCPPPAPQQT